jgi:hypothetical protein
VTFFKWCLEGTTFMRPLSSGVNSPVLTCGCGMQNIDPRAWSCAKGNPNSKRSGPRSYMVHPRWGPYPYFQAANLCSHSRCFGWKSCGGDCFWWCGSDHGCLQWFATGLFNGKAGIYLLDTFTSSTLGMCCKQMNQPFAVFTNPRCASWTPLQRSHTLFV